MGNCTAPPPAGGVEELGTPCAVGIASFLRFEPYRSFVADKLSAIRVTLGHVGHDRSVVRPL